MESNYQIFRIFIIEEFKDDWNQFQKFIKIDKKLKSKLQEHNTKMKSKNYKSRINEVNASFAIREIIKAYNATIKKTLLETKVEVPIGNN
jgi:predicted patatin/cPLA2 family phospholipase